MSLKTEKLSDKVHENLLKVKQKLKLSIARVASATTKAMSIVGYYFRGEKNPPEEWIDIFCSVYCVDKYWLINGEGEPIFTGEPDVSLVAKSSQDAGARVREIRKKAGLTQAEFGERVGLSYMGIYSIERGTTHLTPFTSARIEDEFDVGADWLMYGDEEKKEDPVSKKLIDWLWTKPEVREKLWKAMRRNGKRNEAQ